MGAQQLRQRRTPQRPKLRRDVDDKVVGGVLAGIGNYFGVGHLAVRIGFVVVLLAMFGYLAAAYIIAWAIMKPSSAKKVRRRTLQEWLMSKYIVVSKNGTETVRQRSMKHIMKLGLIGFGAAMGAFALLLATIVLLYFIVSDMDVDELTQLGIGFQLSLGITLLSAILLAFLLMIVSFRANMDTLTQRVVRSTLQIGIFVTIVLVISAVVLWQVS